MKFGIAVVFFETIVVHCLISSGVLTDEFDGVSVGLLRGLRFFYFGERDEPFVLEWSLGISWAPFYLTLVQFAI